MAELSKLLSLAEGRSISHADVEISCINDACMVLQPIVQPDLDLIGKSRFVAFLECGAHLQAADLLVPSEWSYIITRYKGGQYEAIIKVSPETELFTASSDNGGLALLSALARLALSSPGEKAN